MELRSDRSVPAALPPASRQWQSSHQLAAKTVAAFNTWAFKREQPSDLTRMQAIVQHAADENQPLHFVLYWGKGPRPFAGAAEHSCLNYLALLASRVQTAYQHGAQIELILTDTHAALNGHDGRSTQAYFDSIRALSSTFGFSTCLLSDVVAAAQPLPYLENAPLDEEMLARLIGSAEKWYRGGADALTGARQYLRMNMSEKEAVGRIYPNSIFLTFNSSDLRLLFPDSLPIFYMYSTRKGCAVKPWFMPDPEDRTQPAGSIA